MRRTELNEEELRHHEVLSRVERKELTLREVVGVLRVSYAQAKGLRQRYRPLPARRCCGATPWQRGQALKSDEAKGVAGAGAGVGTERLWRGLEGWLQAFVRVCQNSGILCVRVPEPAAYNSRRLRTDGVAIVGTGVDAWADTRSWCEARLPMERETPSASHRRKRPIPQVRLQVRAEFPELHRPLQSEAAGPRWAGPRMRVLPSPLSSIRSTRGWADSLFDFVLGRHGGRFSRAERSRPSSSFRNAKRSRVSPFLELSQHCTYTRKCRMIPTNRLRHFAGITQHFER